MANSEEKKLKELGAKYNNLIEKYKKVTERSAEKLTRQIETAEKIPDASERYLALTKIEKRLQKYRAVDFNSKAVGVKISAPVAKWTLCGGVTGIALLAFGPVGALVGAGASIAGSATDIYIMQKKLRVLENNAKINIALKENLEKIKDSFTPAFDNFQKKLDEQKKIILQNDLSSIAASPRFYDLYDNFPAVREAFVRASARESFGSQKRILKPKPPAPEAPSV